MKNKNQLDISPFTFAMMAILLFALAIILRPLFIVLATLAFISGFMAVSGYFSKGKASPKMRKAKKGSIEYKIQQQMEFCRSEISRIDKEVEYIHENIRDIDSKVRVDIDIHENSQRESNRLREEFLNELKLRERKLEFYRICRDKLSTLLYNHQLSEDLQIKQANLEKLKEEHFEDIAKMEAMKTEFQLDQDVLKTMQSLSSKISSSKSLDSVEELRLELIQLTKELRRI